MVRQLPAWRFKLQLFFISAVLGYGLGPGGFLLTESIPRDGLWHVLRQLGYPRLVETLSARLLDAQSDHHFHVAPALATF